MAEQFGEPGGFFDRDAAPERGDPVIAAPLVVVFGVGFWIGGPAICKIPHADWFSACAQYAKADLSGTAGALRTLGTVMWFWFVYIVLSRV